MSITTNAIRARAYDLMVEAAENGHATFTAEDTQAFLDQARSERRATFVSHTLGRPHTTKELDNMAQFIAEGGLEALGGAPAKHGQLWERAAERSCATCGDTDHATAEHSNPVDAIPADLDEAVRYA